MYEAFYGFREKPFSLAPDPGFLYLGKKHGTAMTMLEYGLANHVGITVITGEIGSGKTTLIRQLLNQVPDDLVIGLISNTHANFGNLMQWVSSAFDLAAENSDQVALYEAFVRFLVDRYASGKRAVLIVDEAQNMDAIALEELRLLTNINADKDQVFQLVLAGQPELRERLRRPELAQFVQRIGVDFHLMHLDADETDAYIQHRLRVAGGEEGLFEPLARRFIHYQCGGVPRLINQLCDTALVYGFADEKAAISAELVLDVVRERVERGLFGAGAVETASAGEAEAMEGVLLKFRKASEDLGRDSGVEYLAR